MQTLRFEARNTEGRITTVLEKDFYWYNGPMLAKWIRNELYAALSNNQTVTIRRLPDNE